MKIKTKILPDDIIGVFLSYGSTTYRFMVDVDEALEIHDILGRAIFTVRFPGKDFPVNVGIDLDEDEPDMETRLNRPNDTTNVVSFKK